MKKIDNGEQKVHRRFVKDFGLLMVQLKTDTEGDMNRGVGNLCGKQLRLGLTVG